MLPHTVATSGGNSMARGVWVFDPDTGELVSKDQFQRKPSQKRMEASAVHDTREVQKGTWIWDRTKGEVVPKSEYRGASGGITVIKDLDPYKNVRGEVIGGRKQHRDFLRAHNAVEVGNEKIEKQYEAPRGVGDDIKRALEEHGGASNLRWK